MISKLAYWCVGAPPQTPSGEGVWTPFPEPHLGGAHTAPPGATPLGTPKIVSLSLDKPVLFRHNSPERLKQMAECGAFFLLG